MNWDGIEGNRHQFKSHVKQQRSMLTDDHLDKSAGRREHLVGKIQENYGVAEHEAECQVMDWEHGHQDLFAESAVEVRKHNVGLKGQ